MTVLFLNNLIFYILIFEQDFVLKLKNEFVWGNLFSRQTWVPNRVSSEKEKSFREKFEFSRNFFFRDHFASFCISFAREKCKNFRTFREKNENYAKKTQKNFQKYIAS